MCWQSLVAIQPSFRRLGAGGQRLGMAWGGVAVSAVAGYALCGLHHPAPCHSKPLPTCIGVQGLELAGVVRAAMLLWRGALHPAPRAACCVCAAHPACLYVCRCRWSTMTAHLALRVCCVCGNDSSPHCVCRCRLSTTAQLRSCWTAQASILFEAAALLCCWLWVCPGDVGRVCGPVLDLKCWT